MKIAGDSTLRTAKLICKEIRNLVTLKQTLLKVWGIAGSYTVVTSSE